MQANLLEPLEKIKKVFKFLKRKGAAEAISQIIEEQLLSFDFYDKEPSVILLEKLKSSIETGETIEHDKREHLILRSLINATKSVGEISGQNLLDCLISCAAFFENRTGGSRDQAFNRQLEVLINKTKNPESVMAMFLTEDSLYGLTKAAVELNK